MSEGSSCVEPLMQMVYLQVLDPDSSLQTLHRTEIQ